MLRRVQVAIIAAVLLTPSISAAVSVGKPAPGFSLTTLDHKKYSLADLKGKVIVLNYWASWCAPCRGEVVVMENYMRNHPGTDLKIFAIDTMDSVPESRLKALAAKLSFPLALGIWTWSYGTIGGALPTSYVIDRSGVVRYAAAGAFTDESFDATMAPLLAEPAPADGAVERIAAKN